MCIRDSTKYTAQALPHIIVDIQEEGYQIVPVGELICQEEYEIDHAGRQHAKEKQAD